MTQEHPITPPPELLARWEEDWHYAKVKHIELEDHIATEAARWGADQELEACCEWLEDPDLNVDTYKLRAARRPKPPSLKGQIAAEIENGTACDRESESIAHDVIHELAAWIDGLGYHSCATELLGEINQ